MALMAVIRNLSLYKIQLPSSLLTPAEVEDISPSTGHTCLYLPPSHNVMVIQRYILSSPCKIHTLTHYNHPLTNMTMSINYTSLLSYSIVFPPYSFIRYISVTSFISCFFTSSSATGNGNKAPNISSDDSSRVYIRESAQPAQGYS